MRYDTGSKHCRGPLRCAQLVAQAMATGTTCFISDTPSHRALVCDGKTGYVCTNQRDFLEKLQSLLRDTAERKRIGEAARREAEQRFTLRHFEKRRAPRVWDVRGHDGSVSACEPLRLTRPPPVPSAQRCIAPTLRQAARQ